MINKINGLDICKFLPTATHLELLEGLLQPEDGTYPWNLVDEGSESYFHELEQQFGCDDLLSEDLTRRSEDFYHNLDALWDQVYHSKTDHDEKPSKSLQTTLHNAFAALVPANWLNTIAQKAVEIINLELSASEQLVECVQSLVPNFATEDLCVLVRHFEPAMRSYDQNKLAVLISNIENRGWTGLSEIEQAKAAFAIAQYAFQELSDLDNKS
ncbi:hypothetical protein A0J48_018815 [Sphaerospermopsis aphanizomenoides BCCUSP55]|uniref:hypothetical protein n=1 Tax=Sphaerospermopsis aphanizomenoides TaxID=459663 RepID=UPI000B18A069|nr:hypothetical protein [Sphaerospermopsis aphanizomenoides]MBK1989561.1 hypothetical protein [Sphaerospermopsis aphanizomenoides BCCUSP55]